MSESIHVPLYRESTIADEPILGPVLFLPDGSIKQLTWLERVMVALRLTSAKELEARYYRPRGS